MEKRRLTSLRSVLLQYLVRTALACLLVAVVWLLVLMLLYNGQRGKGHKQLFYWFYPAHVYLLYGASCLVYNVLR